MTQTITQEAQDKVKVFKDSDKVFKEALEKFETTHELELITLNNLREERNVKLDEARRAIRADTELLDDMRITFPVDVFKVQKKWSDFYIPEKLVSMLSDKGLYDQALSAGIVAIKTEVAKFDQVKKFLEDNGVLDDFECCEDGKEDSIAISGPKQIPPFGQELKKE